MPVDDGGQAFPGQGLEDGMTLRDYYKGQIAVQMLMRKHLFDRFGKGRTGDSGDTAADVATFCGVVADALIAENGT